MTLVIQKSENIYEIEKKYYNREELKELKNEILVFLSVIEKETRVF
jgi:hypothetical protein